MTTEQAVIVIPSIIIMLLPFVLAYIKATMHFNYLRTLYPEKYGRYNHLMDYQYSSWQYLNVLKLYFPSFHEEDFEDKTEDILKAEKGIRLISKLTIIAFVILVIFFVLLMVISPIAQLSSDFSVN